MTLMGSILVGFGAALGALARYEIGLWVARKNNSDYPWGTWIVNMAGTFLLGLVFLEFVKLNHNSGMWLVCGTGFCGGFTTFSTMSVEAVNLLKTKPLLSLVYLGTSLSLGLILAWMTIWL